MTGQTENSQIRLALVQFEPVLGEMRTNREKVLRMAEECAGMGAKIVVFPELCTSGCMLESREETYRAAEPVPNGPTTQGLAEIAARRGIYIVAGLAELGEGGVSCYNSAVLVGPGGYMGKHRKLNLWDVDKLYFEPGDLGYQVFPTIYGKIGMLICYDMWFPENFRILAEMGADLICCPTNWMQLSPDKPESMGLYMAMAGAGANHVYVAAADRVGTERGVTYCGRSAVMDPVGWPAAGPCTSDREEILYADVNLLQAREVYVGKMNGVLADRRTDLYDKMLGYRPPKNKNTCREDRCPPTD